jgi:hypothetical protein
MTAAAQSSGSSDLPIGTVRRLAPAPWSGQSERVEPRTYRASLRRGFGWGFWFLVLAIVGVLAFPDVAWGARILGLVLAALLATYSILIVCTRVVISDDRVLVRRITRWRAYRLGDEFGLESFQPGLGGPERTIVLRSDASGRSRIPIERF